MNGETLQEFAAALEQLAHRTLVGLYSKRGRPCFYWRSTGLGGETVCLDGKNRSLNEALNQALKLETAEAAQGPPARLRELTGAPARASQPSDRRLTDDLCTGSAAPSVTCADSAGRTAWKRPGLWKRINEGENPIILIFLTCKSLVFSQTFICCVWEYGFWCFSIPK